MQQIYQAVQQHQVGKQGAEVGHGTDTKEDKRRIDTKLYAEIEVIKNAARVFDLNIFKPVLRDYRAVFRNISGRRLRDRNKLGLGNIGQACKGQVCKKHTESYRQKQHRLKLFANGKINKNTGHTDHYEVSPLALNKTGKTGFGSEVNYSIPEIL